MLICILTVQKRDSELLQCQNLHFWQERIIPRDDSALLVLAHEVTRSLKLIVTSTRHDFADYKREGARLELLVVFERTACNLVPVETVLSAT